MNNNIRIAFVTSELSHSYGKMMGGLGNVAIEMLKYLSTIPDLNIYVFTLSTLKKREVVVQVDGNIKYHWFPEELYGSLTEDFSGAINKLNQHMTRYIIETYLSKDFLFDIMHFHDWMSIRTMLGISKKSYPSIKKILHMHSSEYGRNGNNYLPPEDFKSREKLFLEVSGCHDADVVVAVSKMFADELHQQMFVPRDKLTYLNNGMSFKDWIVPSLNPMEARRSIGLNDSDPVILFCGRLVYQKNPKLLLNAFIKVQQAIPRARLIFLGDGHEKAELEGIAQKAGLWQTAVHLLGSVYGTRKIEWYATADLMVVSSYNEPFGLIVLESLISRTPVMVCNNISPVGFLLKEHMIPFEPTADDLANKMISSLKNKHLLNQMGEHGFEYVQNNFTDVHMGKGLVDIYRNSVNKVKKNNWIITK